MENGIATFNVNLNQLCEIRETPTDGNYIAEPDMTNAYMVAHLSTTPIDKVPLHFSPSMTTLKITVRGREQTNTGVVTVTGISIINENVQAALKELIKAFDDKKKEFANIIKMGRTQLQDAVPMTLGQSFGAFADAMRHESSRLQKAADEFLYTNMGATAIGTGITAEPNYAKYCTEYLREITGLDIKLSRNLIEATHDTSCMVAYSSALKSIAVRLSKICNDLRLMSSGPRTGIEEIKLPPKQPGSSIMPGKVNPVIPEVVNQVCFKVIGNDFAVTMASEAAQLELNVMEPIMVESLVESATWMTRAFRTLRVECIEGIEANKKHCEEQVKHSIGIVTALKPYIGYSNCTEIAKEALESGKSVYDLVLERNLLTKKQLDVILNPKNMIHPSMIADIRKND